MNKNIQRTENMHKLEIQACQEGPLLPAMKNRSQFTIYKEAMDLFATFYC